MPEKKAFMEPQDYIDPPCPFCAEQYEKAPPARRIPGDRVLRKLDEYLGRNDAAAAERHLKYWLEEARLGRDLEGELLVRSELLGLCRREGRREDCLAEADRIMELVAEMGLENETAGATAFINRATALKAFGRAAEALPLFARAEAVYERLPDPDRYRLGGLYNNYALALADTGRFGEARAMFQKALAVMERTKGGEPEAAVTWLNLADLEAAEKGAEDAEEAVWQCLDRAEALLDTPGLPRDGNYAFVCEKCASAFSYHGRFLYAEELRRRAAEIYGR